MNKFNSLSELASLEPEVVIGIDGGGSKTLALAASLDGSVIGRGSSGPSNYHTTGIPAAYTALDQAVEKALSAAQRTSHDVQALCLGLGGLGRPEDFPVIQTWAGDRFPGVPLRLVNDGQLLLAAGTPEMWGIGVISGTGSIIIGQDTAGKSARVGGWGYLFGDEGSGYSIGSAALQAVMRAHDGRGASTRLVEALVNNWQLPNAPALINKVYSAEAPRPLIASLAPLVEGVAGEGDPVAQSILQSAGHELALGVQAAVRQLELPNPIPCALGGSVMIHGAYTRHAFESSAESLGLELSPLTPVPEPALGAVRLALSLVRKAT